MLESGTFPRALYYLGFPRYESLVSFAYIGVNVRRRLRIESYYFSRTEALKRARDRCVPMHRVCSTRPGTFCVPFTDSDKELYLNQQHVTSRSWMEWRNRRRAFYRDLFAFAECDIVIALQKDTHFSLSSTYPLTIQFSSSGSTRLTTRKYRVPPYSRELSSFIPYFHNCAKTMCCKGSE